MLAESQSEHLVQFYDTSAYLTDAVAGFVEAGLGAGEAVVVVGTPIHREALKRQLRSRGVRVPTSRYHAFDAGEMLARFMVHGRPDANRFHGAVGALLEKASGGGARRVRAFGEMVAVLTGEGRWDAALRVEELWGEWVERERLRLLCAYPMSAFPREAHGAALERICAQHDRVVPTETFTALDTRRRLADVARLQQKATALETETAERRRAEERLRAQEREEDGLLAALGHELRDPLAAVRNAVAVASLDDVARPHALEMAHRQTERLARIVDDLLCLTRLAQGERLRARRTSLSALVERATETARAVGNAPAVAVVESGDTVHVVADASRMERALVALIAGAGRAGGPVEIAVRREGEWAVVRLQRTGDAELRDAGRVRLALVQRVVALHGGDIESRRGEVVVRLPAA